MSNWTFHQKYRRFYKDFEEDGKFWRRYDNEAGPLVENPPLPQTDPLAPRTTSPGPTRTLPPSQQEYSTTGPIREDLIEGWGFPTRRWTPNSSATSSGYTPLSTLEDHEDSILSRKKNFKDSRGNVVGVSIKARRRGRESSPAKEEAPRPPPDSDAKLSRSRLKTVHSPTSLPAVTERPNVESDAAEEDNEDLVTLDEDFHQQKGQKDNSVLERPRSYWKQPKSEQQEQTGFSGLIESVPGEIALRLENVHIDQPTGTNTASEDHQYFVPHLPKPAQYRHPAGYHSNRPHFISDHPLGTLPVAYQTNSSQWGTSRAFPASNQAGATHGILQTQQPYYQSPYSTSLAEAGAQFGDETARDPTPTLSVDDSATSGGTGYSIKESKVDRGLDSRYVKRKDAARFFRVGMVFALLWPEATGQEGTVLSEQYKGFTKGLFTQQFVASIRRMVVVREGRGHCWCLPISTYNGKGTTKKGLDPTAHAIIYMSDASPQRLRDETRMTKEPLSIDPAKGQKLDVLSRVNFDKVYTIEHNVKVMEVGKVSAKSMPKLVGYWENHRGK